jgi:hypothetical protein
MSQGASSPHPAGGLFSIEDPDDVAPPAAPGPGPSSGRRTPSRSPSRSRQTGDGLLTPTSDETGKSKSTLAKEDLPTPVLSLLGSLDRVKNLLRASRQSPPNQGDSIADEETPLLSKSRDTHIVEDLEKGTVSSNKPSLLESVRRSSKSSDTEKNGDPPVVPSSQSASTAPGPSAPLTQAGYLWLWLTFIGDFIVNGPKPPPPPAPDAKKQPWRWYNAWDIGPNCREIFFRERDSDMNILDGVR